MPARTLFSDWHLSPGFQTPHVIRCCRTRQSRCSGWVTLRGAGYLHCCLVSQGPVSCRQSNYAAIDQGGEAPADPRPGPWELPGQSAWSPPVSRLKGEKMRETEQTVRL